MATVNLSPIGNGVQFLLPSGAVNANGYLSTYQAGTSTPVATYNSSAGSVANATSIPLGTDGAPASEIWIVSGTAVKFILEDSSGVPISGKTWDNIKGINDETGLGVYWCGTATGTANALVLTPAIPSTAYTAGVVYYFKSGAAANTGATTVNISGLGAIAIQDNGSALSGSEIQPNQWYQLLIDATTTAAQLLNVINSLTIPQTLALAAVSFSGAVISTKAAAAGYSRISPNQCQLSGNASFVTLTNSTTTTISAPSANATAVIVELTNLVYGINGGAAGTLRSCNSFLCQDAAGIITQLDTQAVSVDQGNNNGTIGSDSAAGIVYLASVGGSFYIKSTLTGASTNGLAQYAILGYYD